MRRDGGAWSRATVVVAALAAAGVLIAVVAYLAAHLATDRKARSVAPSSTASEVEPTPGQRPSAVARLVFESGSAELPVDALTQAAVVLAAADQAPLSIRSFDDDDGKSNAAALAAARARAVVELLELAGVPPARIDLRAPELRVPGKDGRQTEQVEVSTR